MDNNLNKEAILKAAKSGNSDTLIKNLSSKDKETLNNILNDKQKLKEVLSSPQAAALLKILSGGGKNG